MALYTIGDLHLSHRSDKPMDIFGKKWEGHTDKLKDGFSVLQDDDLCVLCGDISWAMSLEEALDDFLFIDSLPGRKIILKGNHDYWWNTVSKMKRFFSDNSISSIDILHNNCYFYENTAICGTRGWQKDESLSAEKNKQITAKESGRLRASLQAARQQKPGYPQICFFHFPPRFGNYVCNDFIDIMNEYGVRHCYYGHLHGAGHTLGVTGMIDDINYDIISADYIDFKPKRLL